MKGNWIEFQSYQKDKLIFEVSIGLVVCDMTSTTSYFVITCQILVKAFNSFFSKEVISMKY